MVLHCQGRAIFRDEARELSAIVSEVLPTSQRMVIDLAGVDSVDQGGLGELVLTQLWAEGIRIRADVREPQESGATRFRNHSRRPRYSIYIQVLPKPWRPWPSVQLITRSHLYIFPSFLAMKAVSAAPFFSHLLRDFQKRSSRMREIRLVPKDEAQLALKMQIANRHPH